MPRSPARPGFTLNEIIVVVAVFVLMMGISLPYLGDFYRNQNTGAYCKNIRQALYRASYRAIAGERNEPWGVQFNTNDYILFAGPNYANRKTQFDEEHDIPNTMTITAPSEIVFEKFNGQPVTTGTVSLVLDGETTVCAEVNAAGSVE